MQQVLINRKTSERWLESYIKIINNPQKKTVKIFSDKKIFTIAQFRKQNSG